MAVNKQPIAKKCRSFDISPAVMGYGNKKSNRNPGGNRRQGRDGIRSADG